MNDTISPDERLNLAQARCHKLCTSSAILGSLPATEDAARLRVFVETDGPWLINQAHALLGARDIQARRITDLENRLSEAQAKIRNQAGALTTLQAAEGRRAVRGRRGVIS